MLEAAPDITGPREQVLTRDSNAVEGAGADQDMARVEEAWAGDGDAQQ